MQLCACFISDRVFVEDVEKNCKANFKNQKACNVIRMRPQHRCSPLKFAKFLRTPSRIVSVAASGSHYCSATE